MLPDPVRPRDKKNLMVNSLQNINQRKTETQAALALHEKTDYIGGDWAHAHSETDFITAIENVFSEESFESIEERICKCCNSWEVKVEIGAALGKSATFLKRKYGLVKGGLKPAYHKDYKGLMTGWPYNKPTIKHAIQNRWRGSCVEKSDKWKIGFGTKQAPSD